MSGASVRATLNQNAEAGDGNDRAAPDQHSCYQRALEAAPWLRWNADATQTAV